MVFSEDDNLYFQDGNNQSVQLTHGEKTDFIALSDDNQKVMFSRGETPNQTFYSVNVDGSGEQALIIPQWLTQLGDGTTAHFPTFAPNTHQILFNTRLCETKGDTKVCSIGLYLVDADTGKTRELMAPGSPVQYEEQNSNFKISPDGKMVSVVSSGHLDILDMDGNFVNPNILTYTPSAPIELVPVQYWLPDSRGLIVAIPDAVHASAPIPPTQYTVWRYEIGRDAVQVHLDPNPLRRYSELGDVIKVSPNGKWLFYDTSGDVYVGNLENGQTKPITLPFLPDTGFPWSPDSRYLVVGITAIVPIDNLLMPIIHENYVFIEWIDDNHYVVVGKFLLRGFIGEITKDGAILIYECAQSCFLKKKGDKGRLLAI
jgi:Tol biopolymer transport system component